MTTIDAPDPLALYRLPSTPAPPPPDQGFGTDTFLQLLVAQLRYQNPLEPQEGTEFLTQTAQFTMVERLDELAEQTAIQAGTLSVATATAMIGREVSYVLDGTTGHGVVSGVRFDTDGPRLRIGTTDVPMAAVSSVDAAPPADSPAPAAP